MDVCLNHTMEVVRKGKDSKDSSMAELVFVSQSDLWPSSVDIRGCSLKEQPREVADVFFHAKTMTKRVMFTVSAARFRWARCNNCRGVLWAMQALGSRTTAREHEGHTLASTSKVSRLLMSLVGLFDLKAES
jgi:hypothetical protein